MKHAPLVLRFFYDEARCCRPSFKIWKNGSNIYIVMSLLFYVLNVCNLYDAFNCFWPNVSSFSLASMLGRLRAYSIDLLKEISIHISVFAEGVHRKINYRNLIKGLSFSQVPYITFKPDDFNKINYFLNKIKQKLSEVSYESPTIAAQIQTKSTKIWVFNGRCLSALERTPLNNVDP